MNSAIKTPNPVNVAPQIDLKRKDVSFGRVIERIIETLLMLAGVFCVVVTLGIVGILVYESAGFFREVGFAKFFLDTEWTPTFSDKHFGIWPLVAGTMVTTVVALCVAIPVGTICAIWLSEYCHASVREVVKPVLELLSAVPTVVYGYFALLAVTPVLQFVFKSIGVDLPGFNMLSAGLVMGIMIIPYIASLSEDAMRSVPITLREGSYAMGATRVQTAIKVILPSAFSGITAAYILGIARAIGETMIVAIAAGQQPDFTMNPANQGQTITAYIVGISKGDTPHGSLEYRTIYSCGLVLLVMTLIFNLAGYWFRKKYREAY